MESDATLDALRTILITRLRFDPLRLGELRPETPLPKGIEGSIGLDSLDFIELSLAIEERFGIVLDEAEELAPHFASLETLRCFIATKTGAT